jgi:hypothetical protein
VRSQAELGTEVQGRLSVLRENPSGLPDSSEPESILPRTGNTMGKAGDVVWAQNRACFAPFVRGGSTLIPSIKNRRCPTVFRTLIDCRVISYGWSTFRFRGRYLSHRELSASDTVRSQTIHSSLLLGWELPSVGNGGRRRSRSASRLCVKRTRAQLVLRKTPGKSPYYTQPETTSWPKISFPESASDLPHEVTRITAVAP